MVYRLPKEAIDDNELEASQLSSNLVNSFVPIGGIIMWSGTIAEAEALTNWAIVMVKTVHLISEIDLY